MNSLTSTLAGIGTAVALATTLEMIGVSQAQYEIGKSLEEASVENGLVWSSERMHTPQIAGGLRRYVLTDMVAPSALGLLIYIGLSRKYGDKK